MLTIFGYLLDIWKFIFAYKKLISKLHVNNEIHYKMNCTCMLIMYNYFKTHKYNMHVIWRLKGS
jgi:hypothetical protein